MARQGPRSPRPRADAPAAGRASRGIDLIWIYPHLVSRVQRNVHARPRWRAHPQTRAERRIRTPGRRRATTAVPRRDGAGAARGG